MSDHSIVDLLNTVEENIISEEAVNYFNSRRRILHIIYIILLIIVLIILIVVSAILSSTFKILDSSNIVLKDIKEFLIATTEEPLH